MGARLRKTTAKPPSRVMRWVPISRSRASELAVCTAWLKVGELASDSASALAFAAAYCESSSATRVESWRSCEAGCENQRSMERFSSPKLNRNMNTAGAKESSRAPTNIRLRILEPSTRLRWSASNFTMLRKSRTSNVSSSRKAITESALNRKIWLVPCGRRNGRLKAFSAASSRRSRNMPPPSATTALLRCLDSVAMCLTAYRAGNKAAYDEAHEAVPARRGRSTLQRVHLEQKLGIITGLTQA